MTKIFVDKIFFGPNIFFGPKFFLGKFFLDQEFFSDQKFFWGQTFLENFFWQNFVFGHTDFFLKTLFFSKSFLSFFSDPKVVVKSNILIFGPLPQRVGLSLVGYGSHGGEQQLWPDLSFIIQTYGPNFGPVVNILLVDFGGGLFLLFLFLLFLFLLLQGKTKSTPRLKVLV